MDMEHEVRRLPIALPPAIAQPLIIARAHLLSLCDATHPVPQALFISF